jgi:hypothetical protein
MATTLTAESTVPTVVLPQTPRITLRTWLAFLFGGRRAILAIAGSRQALWVGLLFTLSAGFAREYDGAYLWREPWHFVLPVVASLATSLALFALVYLPSRDHQMEELRWWPGYRTVLTFFWMAAPMAWLYAIPVERFMEPGPATEANLTLLAIVSVWRVLLVTRALAVWLGAGFFSMLFIVLFFADTVALVLATVTPTPVWNIMGGVRVGPREQAILDAKHMVWFFGGIGWLVLLVAAIVAITESRRWQVNESSSDSRAARVGSSFWALGALLVLAGIGFLPVAQAEQQRRWQADRLLRSGQVVEAVGYISNQGRAAFPPHWDPAPRTAYGEDVPKMTTVIEALRGADAPAWLYEMYLEKQLSRYYGISEAVETAATDNGMLLLDLVAFLEAHPPGGEFKYAVENQLSDAAANMELDSAVRERVQQYLDRRRKPAIE